MRPFLDNCLSPRYALRGGEKARFEILRDGQVLTISQPRRAAGFSRGREPKDASFPPLHQPRMGRQDRRACDYYSRIEGETKAPEAVA